MHWVAIGVEGDPDGVPPGVDLSAYRIVQEGLTNVLRYGGPEATVSIRCPGGTVEVEIRDGGAATPRPAGLGTGHGLIGMRERVAVFGGRFAAGALPGGGYRVSATLPFGAVDRVGSPG